jgi:hypothetical protein
VVAFSVSGLGSFFGGLIFVCLTGFVSSSLTHLLPSCSRLKRRGGGEVFVALGCISVESKKLVVKSMETPFPRFCGSTTTTDLKTFSLLADDLKDDVDDLADAVGINGLRVSFDELGRPVVFLSC